MKIIGISGIARSGKDTMALTLKSEIENFFPNKRVEIFSLASTLKNEMREFILQNFDTDILYADGQTKENFRPLMVGYGHAKRMTTQGMYFIKCFEKAAANIKADYYIIPDIRYADFEFDEVDWLKKNQGLLVHIRKHSLDEKGKKVYKKAPNEDEKRNDPRLKSLSDFKIDWVHFEDSNLLLKESSKYSKDFISDNLTWFVK